MNDMRHYVFVSILLAGLTTAASAADFPCPEPLKQTETDIKADLSGQATAFLKVGSAELKGRVEKTVVDLFSKYPNADRVGVISTMLSTTCHLIRTSQMSDSEKFDKWISVFPVIRSFLPDDKK